MKWCVGCCRITDDTGKVSLEDAGIILEMVPFKGAVKRGGLDERIARDDKGRPKTTESLRGVAARVSARLRTKLKRKYAFGRLVIDPSTL